MRLLDRSVDICLSRSPGGGGGGSGQAGPLSSSPLQGAQTSPFIVRLRSYNLTHSNIYRLPVTRLTGICPNTNSKHSGLKAFSVFVATCDLYCYELELWARGEAKAGSGAGNWLLTIVLEPGWRSPIWLRLITVRWGSPSLSFLICQTAQHNHIWDHSRGWRT